MSMAMNVFVHVFISGRTLSSHFLTVMDITTMNIHVRQVFVWMYVFISLGTYLRVGLLGHVITLLNLLRNSQTVFQNDCTILHPISNL